MGFEVERFGVDIADDAVAIDDDGHAIVDARGFIEDAVSAAGRVTGEVAEEGELEAELFLEFAGGSKGINRDAQDLGIGLHEPIGVGSEGRHFGCSATGESEGIEGEDEVLSRERIQGNFLAPPVAKGNGWGGCADFDRHGLTVAGRAGAVLPRASMAGARNRGGRPKRGPCLRGAIRRR